MYHFVSGFINVTDLLVDVGWQVPTILDKIVGTFSYVFFKVLKNFHNQELTCKTLSVR